MREGQETRIEKGGGNLGKSSLVNWLFFFPHCREAIFQLEVLFRSILLFNTVMAREVDSFLCTDLTSTEKCIEAKLFLQESVREKNGGKRASELLQLF